MRNKNLELYKIRLERLGDYSTQPSHFTDEQMISVVLQIFKNVCVCLYICVYLILFPQTHKHKYGAEELL